MKDKKQQKTSQPRIGGNVAKVIISGIGAILCFLLIVPMLNKYTFPERVNTESLAQTFAVIDSSGGTYYGTAVDLAYTGTGEFQFLSGEVYEGEFQDSQRSGSGVFTWSNGDSYSGTWENDNMLNGTYSFANGNSYTGSFTDNKFDSGTFTLGKEAENAGFSSYSASYEKGELKKLDYTAKDGSSYKGYISGETSIVYASGNTYVGEVINGVRNGTGKYTWKEAGKVQASYDGTWSDGVMQGSGKYYYTSSSYPYISGTFKNGKPDGTAVYYKESGNTFSTTWSNGQCTSVKES